MGLKEKIKDVLHGDKDEPRHSAHSSTHGTTTGTTDNNTYGTGTTGTTGTTGNTYGSGTTGTTAGNTFGSGTTHEKMPGTYDESTFGDSKLDDTKYGDTKYGGSTTAGTGRDYQTGSTFGSTTGDRTHNLSGSHGHRPTDSGVGLGDHTYDKHDKVGANTTTGQNPYWGNVGQGRNSPPGTSSTVGGTDRLDRKELPLRPGEQSSSTTGDFGSGNRTSATGPASGGVYNTVAGAGSPDFERDNHGHHALNTVGYQNQSPTTRNNDPAGYDSRLRDRDMGHDSRGLGAGTAAGIGAGAGLTGAGLNRDRERDLNEHSEMHARDMGLDRSDRYQPGGGAPQTSLLDPYQTGPNAGRTAGPHDSNMANKMDPRVDSDRDGRDYLGTGAYGTTTTGYGNTRSGPHDSNMANKMDPRVDSDRDNFGSNTAYGMSSTGYGSARTGPHDSNVANRMDPRVDSDRDGSRFGHDGRSGMGAGAAGLSSSGERSHYGPAHEGAKVMHRCTGCGLDNDISQYFRKDAVYRMS